MPQEKRRASEEGVGAKAKQPENTALDSLKRITKVVADTGDYESLASLKAVDATTNPSLIYQAVQMPQYKHTVQDAVERAKTLVGTDKEKLVPAICDQLLVAFAKQTLSLIPGVVSVEIDARLSFDKDASIKKAHQLVNLFAQANIPKERLLIKLASTWEGCQAARQLQSENINCNLTLMFSMAQAVAAAEADAFLISPFVGRILDWHKAANPAGQYEKSKDPGVQSVQKIYAYYKKFGYKTIVMGASFRNIDEILELAGCDNLTISPKFLKELDNMPASAITKKLDAEDMATKCDVTEKIHLDEKTFRWMLNEDQMATEKLSDGIRKFNEDWDKLKKWLVQEFCQ